MYEDFYYDEVVVRPVYLYNEIPILITNIYLCRDGPLTDIQMQLKLS